MSTLPTIPSLLLAQQAKLTLEDGTEFRITIHCTKFGQIFVQGTFQFLWRDFSEAIIERDKREKQTNIPQGESV